MSKAASSQAPSAYHETIILMLCGLLTFIVCLTLHLVGVNTLTAFNFFLATVGIFLIPVSLLAKNVRLVRMIAVVGMTIAVASVIVNPPWAV
ncbi:hypothetical protein [Pseudomonas urmiensis]|jgi:hypothetical protein|uniref:Uncharacterized protein n=1 Tax=Pseudomonas urmiensis TaxID=2745493 RepID=A0A923FWX2_9PSED|nr:hypothetical protein [Pseudomonas urmiensis]MBV4535840.1 hypothetical protein [Pseudomonas urmiensis]